MGRKYAKNLKNFENEGTGGGGIYYTGFVVAAYIL